MVRHHFSEMTRDKLPMIYVNKIGKNEPSD